MRVAPTLPFQPSRQRACVCHSLKNVENPSDCHPISGGGIYNHFPDEDCTAGLELVCCVRCVGQGHMFYLAYITISLLARSKSVTTKMCEIKCEKIWPYAEYQPRLILLNAVLNGREMSSQCSIFALLESEHHHRKKFVIVMRVAISWDILATLHDVASPLAHSRSTVRRCSSPSLRAPPM